MLFRQVLEGRRNQISVCWIGEIQCRPEIGNNGWFAARQSGTEAIYKIYAESFRNAQHLDFIVKEAQALVAATVPE